MEDLGTTSKSMFALVMGIGILGAVAAHCGEEKVTIEDLPAGITAQLRKMFPGAEISLEDAKEMVAAGRDLIEGIRRPILTDISDVKSVTRQAREHFASEEAERNCLASGVVVSSPVSRAIGNFFLGMLKHSFPVKLFDSHEKALEWLKRFRQPQGL